MAAMLVPAKSWSRAAALALAGLLPGCAGGNDAQFDPEAFADLPTRRPNILFILSDDHARNAYGAYGAAVRVTPNLDRLAAEGMRFDRACVGNSICAPARATVLTGLHSHAHGIVDNSGVFDGGMQTFPQLLQAGGYQTALIGKWHLKSDPTGFDHWEVLRGQGPYYNPRLLTPDGDRDYQGYTTEVLTDRALAWLEDKRESGKPFLLCYQHKAPHRRWQPGPRQFGMFEGVEIPEPPTLFDTGVTRARGFHAQEMTIREHLFPEDLKLVPPGNLTDEQLALWEQAYAERQRILESGELEGEELVRFKYRCYQEDYLASVSAMDDGVGQVLDWLDANGLADNTLVVYMGDQGFYLGEHGWYDKRWMYEESFGTPLVMRWPGVVSAGSADTNLVQNIDIAPTLLEAAGVAAEQPMHGESLLPLLRGETPPTWRDALYYRYYESEGPHKVAKHYGIATAHEKLIHYPELGEWEYFDLREDPLEMDNRYGEPGLEARIAELESELYRLQASYGDAP